jgi:hypothetical protein
MDAADEAGAGCPEHNAPEQRTGGLGCGDDRSIASLGAALSPSMAKPIPTLAVDPPGRTSCEQPARVGPDTIDAHARTVKAALAKLPANCLTVAVLMTLRRSI